MSPEDRNRRTMTDPQRMLWRDDVEGVCPSPDLCFDEYCERVRCGPCAIKQATLAGIESDLSVPNLPEVYRLRRALQQYSPDIDRSGLAQEVERREYCDDTGDVHRTDGEWLGECTCGRAMPKTS